MHAVQQSDAQDLDLFLVIAAALLMRLPWVPHHPCPLSLKPAVLS
jgi:hypothetical protein